VVIDGWGGGCQEASDEHTLRMHEVEERVEGTLMADELVSRAGKKGLLQFFFVRTLPNLTASLLPSGRKNQGENQKHQTNQRVC
jgi:hypothetical protein